MQELITYIVRGIVSEPDEVFVNESERRGEPSLQIEVAEADRGVVIGRSGRTIRAMETVLRASCRGEAPALDVAD